MECPPFGIPFCTANYVMIGALMVSAAWSNPSERSTGRVISDDHDIYRAYTWSQAAPTPQSAIAKWLNAGGSTNYADWSTTQWNEYVVDAVNTSMVSLDTLKLRVKEQLAVKYDLGLFDNPYYPENFTQGKVDRQSTADLASEAGSKSIVMLKNDGILPMDKDQPPKSPLLDHLVTRTRSSEVGMRRLAYLTASRPLDRDSCHTPLVWLRHGAQQPFSITAPRSFQCLPSGPLETLTPLD